MADKVSFEIVSPDRLLMATEVDMVVVPGAEGDFGVLPAHAPMISTLRPGLVEIHDDDKDVERVFVRGGFAEVTPEGLTVLAEQAIPLADLDRATLEQEIGYAKEDLADSETDESRDKAQQQHDHLAQLLDAMD